MFYVLSSQPMASARNMASADLQELPFTPLHAPIMAMAPGMHRYVPMIEEGGGGLQDPDGMGIPH